MCITDVTLDFEFWEFTRGNGIKHTVLDKKNDQISRMDKDSKERNEGSQLENTSVLLSSKWLDGGTVTE